MLDWNEYIAQLISQSSSLDGISLSLGDLSKPVGIPSPERRRSKSACDYRVTRIN